MVTRREFAGALACGLAASELPRVSVVTAPAGARVPDRFAATSCVFTTAYAACGNPSLARTALLTGRFPHARSAAVRFSASLGLASDSAPAIFVADPKKDDTPFDSSVRVALAIRHPRLPRGKVFDFPVSTVDVAPTMLALMNLDAPDHLHGRDLSALLTAGKGERPESIFAEGDLNTPGEWRMVVRGLDKIVTRTNLDVLHLFNLGEDPAEERDLAREIGYRLKVDELLALVRMWMKRTGDGMDPSGLKRR